MTTYIVGLTGGIGCGKSTIEKMFTNHGNNGIIDTDLIVRELQEPGESGYVFIREAFGDSYINFDGTLNRDMLRNTVFNESAAKDKLSSILTPLIYHECLRRIKEHKAAWLDIIPNYLILTVPLLLDSKLFQNLVDRILVVDCPVDVQVERVMKRSKLRKQDVEKIIAAQRPRYFRIMKADDVIHNYDCEPIDNDKIVEQLHERYLELAVLKK
jgi:dephospho-CoA kinase